MKSGVHKAIAALVLLSGAIAPRMWGAPATGSRSVASVVFTGSAKAASIEPSSSSLFSCGAEATVWTSDPSSSPRAIPLGFAMADFTGDSHPDLVTLELDRLDSSTAYYLIEIQLTEGGHQSLRLTAPARGLVITAKDVTGDGTLDLVVRAVGSQAPVAVFLNDGCGRFSPREPTPFARKLQDVPAGSAFTSAPQQFFAAAVITPGSCTTVCQRVSRRPLQEQGSSLLSTNDEVPSRLFSPFGANRAPPEIA